MGWTPVNKIQIERVFEGNRSFVVKWYDDQLGWQTKEFKYKEQEQALEFMCKTFKQLAM